MSHHPNITTILANLPITQVAALASISAASGASFDDVLGVAVDHALSESRKVFGLIGEGVRCADCDSRKCVDDSESPCDSTVVFCEVNGQFRAAAIFRKCEYFCEGDEHVF